MTESYQPGILAPLIPDKQKNKKTRQPKLEAQPGSRKMMPLIPAPPVPVKKEIPGRNPYEAGFLNLNGLGLGYLYLHRWVRWGIHLALLAGLIIAAYLSKGHTLPWLWAGLFVLLVLWMVFDGWRIARKVNSQTGKKSVQSKIAAWAVGGSAFLIVVGAYTGYSLLGKSAFARGMAAYQENNCVSAEKSLSQMNTVFELTLSRDIDTANQIIAECSQVVAGDKKIESTSYEAGIKIYQEFIQANPNSSLVASVKQKIAMAYINWGMALRTSGKYEEAIAKFQEVKNGFPEAAVSSNVDDKLAATTLLWADNLRISGSFDAAISKYKAVQSQFPTSSSADDAGKAVIETYDEWAADLLAKHQYQEAIAKYAFLQSQYPNTSEGKQAGTQIGVAYLDWSTSLTDSGDFNGSMAIINTALETITDPGLVDKLHSRYQEAILGLSRDTGPQGQKIVNETIALACEGKPATSEAVGFGNAPAKAFFCDYSEVILPMDLFATTPGEIKYVLKFNSGTSTLETCPYEGGYSFSRYQDYWTITVISTKTGKITNSNTFYGSSPEACAGSRWFTIGDYSDSASGGPPDENAVIKWLQNVLK